MNLVFLKNPKFGVGCVSLLLAFVVDHPNDKEKKSLAIGDFVVGAIEIPKI